jgi:hypothetical protein
MPRPLCCRRLSAWPSFSFLVCRQKANAPDAEVTQDCGRQAAIPAIGLEAEDMIGLDGVDADILQLVGLQLRHQANAAALLMFVDH